MVKSVVLKVKPVAALILTIYCCWNWCFRFNLFDLASY